MHTIRTQIPWFRFRDSEMKLLHKERVICEREYANTCGQRRTYMQVKASLCWLVSGWEPRKEPQSWNLVRTMCTLGYPAVPSVLSKEAVDVQKRLEVYIFSPVESSFFNWQVVFCRWFYGWLDRLKYIDIISHICLFWQLNTVSNFSN